MYTRPEENSANALFSLICLFADKTRSQLFKLHEMYENKFDLNSCTATSKHLNGDTVRAVSRCQSMMLSELCNPGENNLRSNDFENSSIASEPAYIAVSLSILKFAEAYARIVVGAMEKITAEKERGTRQ